MSKESLHPSVEGSAKYAESVYIKTLEQRIAELEAKLAEVPGQVEAAYIEGREAGAWDPAESGEESWKTSNARRRLSDGGEG